MDTPIIIDPLDTDLYKLTQQQTVFHQYPNAVIRYEFLCRNKDIKLGFLVDKLRPQIGHFRSVRLTEEYALKLAAKCPFLAPDYIEFLKNFKFDPIQITVRDDNGDLRISIKGRWVDTILWEVPLLAVVNELYFKHMVETEDSNNTWRLEGADRLKDKLQMLKQYPRFKFAEFGTRRRFSKEWQKNVIRIMAKECPQLVGTSNIKLALDFDLTPVGTMAHEFISAHLALAGSLAEGQKTALYSWLQEYDSNLGIALTDTFTSDAFFKDFGVVLSNAFAGLRHDSGDPIEFGYKAIEHYKNKGIDPLSKVIVFSDGLDIPEALRIYREFTGMIGVSFGIGTNLTNDVGFTPLNIVIKAVECNGQPIVKLSDNPGKAMGDLDMIEQVRKAYGVA